VKLLLLLVMTGTAAADGFVGTVRLGTAFIDAKPADHGFGYVGAIEGGYQLGRFRGSLALDFTNFDTRSGDEHIGYLLESATAQVQADVIADVVFAFAGIGASTTGGDNQQYALRYQVGVGGRLWLSHDDAVRIDASFAGDKVAGRSLAEPGAALGYEHYF
jgi:hypothetical protein